LQKHQWWMHGIPLTIGIGLAFAGIPFYENVVVGCHVSIPPYASWYPTIIFTLAPIFIVIIGATAITIRVYLKVRNQVRSTKRWRFLSQSASASSSRNTNIQNSSSIILPQEDTSSREFTSQQPSRSRVIAQPPVAAASQQMERGVFWQAFWYLSAFYITWTLNAVAILKAGMDMEDNSRNNRHIGVYWLWLTFVMFGPLQGHWNAIVYFRPRVIRYYRRRQRLVGTRRPIFWEFIPCCGFAGGKGSPQIPVGETEAVSTPMSSMRSSRNASNNIEDIQDKEGDFELQKMPDDLGIFPIQEDDAKSQAEP